MRRVRNAKIETRSSRLKLPPSRNPYWTSLAEGLHLGYDRGKWIVRFYLGKVEWQYRGKETTRRYEKKVIGTADDYGDADGLTVLSFDQAQAKARELHSHRAHAEHGLHVGPYTVADAITDYVQYMVAQGRATAKDVGTRARAHIIPTLGQVNVADLTSERLRAFLAQLASEPARVRSVRGGPVAHRKDNNPRARKASANRIYAILRAALNHAFDEKKVPSNHAWGRRVKPFRNVEGKRDRILTIPEAQRLIMACDEPFRSLVQAALMTGARFGELTRLAAHDFKNTNISQGSVHIQRSKSGRERYVTLTEEGIALFKRLCRGRARTDVLFTYTKAQQRVAFHAALARAEINPPITFHGLRHTYCSLSVMNGMPLVVLAQTLGHVDTRMVQKHYAHLAHTYIADEVRKGAPRYG
jgi:integrase